MTVNLAFSELEAEGYLIAKTGSGTFVADPLPEAFLNAGNTDGSPQLKQETHVSDRVNRIPDSRVGEQFDLGPTGAAAGVLLQSGIPAVDEFPIETWERIRAQLLAKKGVPLTQHIGPLPNLPMAMKQV